MTANQNSEPRNFLRIDWLSQIKGVSEVFCRGHYGLWLRMQRGDFLERLLGFVGVSLVSLVIALIFRAFAVLPFRLLLFLSILPYVVQ